MSMDLVVSNCPVCGGDRTSAASNRELYCVDCNRIYLVDESIAPEALALKPTDALLDVLYLKRAA